MYTSITHIPAILIHMNQPIGVGILVVGFLALIAPLRVLCLLPELLKERKIIANDAPSVSYVSVGAAAPKNCSNDPLRGYSASTSDAVQNKASIYTREPRMEPIGLRDSEKLKKRPPVAQMKMNQTNTAEACV